MWKMSLIYLIYLFIYFLLYLRIISPKERPHTLFKCCLQTSLNIFPHEYNAAQSESDCLK